jgi:hypothetical protein
MATDSDRKIDTEDLSVSTPQQRAACCLAALGWPGDHFDSAANKSIRVQIEDAVKCAIEAARHPILATPTASEGEALLTFLRSMRSQAPGMDAVISDLIRTVERMAADLASLRANHAALKRHVAECSQCAGPR